MIRVQALNNNHRSKLARRQEHPPMDATKPVAMSITHHHNDVRADLADMPRPVLRLSVQVRKHHRHIRTGMSVYSYLSHDGLLVISLGLACSRTTFQDDILSLDDESLHRFVSIIVYHILDAHLFSDHQMFFIDLGRCISTSEGKRHQNARWYAGNLKFIQYLGNKSQRETTLYYDGTNKLDLSYDIQ